MPEKPARDTDKFDRVDVLCQQLTNIEHGIKRVDRRIVALNSSLALTMEAVKSLSYRLATLENWCRQKTGGV